MQVVVFGDNQNEETKRGMNDSDTTKARMLGKDCRDYLCRKLSNEEMKRPDSKKYKKKISNMSISE